MTIVPVVLSCGHTICNICSIKIDKCPYDNLPIEIVGKNYALMAALQTDLSDPTSATTTTKIGLLPMDGPISSAKELLV